MKCKRCLNEDPRYFYKGSKGYYCRKCIEFNRILINEDINSIPINENDLDTNINLTYPLTIYQKEISNKCVSILNNNQDVFLNCVCGAGKTEIVVESIKNYLDRHKKVCFAISRKEVVVDLYYRFKKIFNKLNVVAVYGGHHEEINGDLIICTTHQLFRYYQSFDLLILDEVDGYPLSGNETLMNISINSCRGNIIFSSATRNKFIDAYLSKRNYVELNLYFRPSLKPLIIPRVIYSFKLLDVFILYKIINKLENQTIIFLESKKECKFYYSIFKRIINCSYTYSDLKERDKNIKDFKEKKYKYLFSTTLLERGITINDVNVVLIINKKNIYDSSSIIQCLGRVGRNFNNPYGKSFIIYSSNYKEINNSIKQLEYANNKLNEVLDGC